LAGFALKKHQYLK